MKQSFSEASANHPLSSFTPIPSQEHTRLLQATELLTTDQVAAALGLSPRTLGAWRSSRHSTLQWCRVGNRIRYRSADVAAWLESQVRSNDAAQEGAA